MKKTIFSIVVATLALMPMHVFAQGLKASGNDAASVVPTTRDDGFVYNFNQPVLAIYWGQKDGSFKLFKQYDDVIPAREDEFLSITPSLDINKKGALEISLEFFATAGSWTQPTTTHVFRYQNGDFKLIGKDVFEYERNTGKTVETSDNYLTRRRTVITSRIDSKKSTTKRSRLRKASLKSLGFPLDE